jgi:hypothetical protein
MKKVNNSYKNNRIIQKYFSKARLEEPILYCKRKMGISTEVSQVFDGG